MKPTTQQPNTLLQTALFGALCSVSLALNADAVIDPLTQPAVTAAPYAVSDTDLSTGDVKAYRPWFENGAWQGDLIEYSVSTAGTLSSSVNASVDPPTNDAGTHWSARLRFNANEAAAPVAYWQNLRKIYTMADGSQKEFYWNNLDDNQQKALDYDIWDAGKIGSLDSPVLNYVRGDRSNEFDETTNPTGPYRYRYNLLGAIIHSNPVYVGAPKAAFQLPGYSDYRNDYENRAGRVYVGSNNGMLHAFDAASGDEVYAYIPSMVIPNLPKLTKNPYTHTYFVDGQLATGDMDFGPAPTYNWRTVVVGGLGSGGRGLFALDVTDPNTAKILWERTAANSNDIGYIHGKAQVALLPLGAAPAEDWYIVQGNGYLSNNGQAKLFIIDKSGNITTLPTDGSTNNGLSHPVLIDINGDHRADYAYAGDLQGNLWKFNLQSGAVTKLFQGSPSKPITTRPDIARHPVGGYIVYFGTGSLLSGPTTPSADSGNKDTQTIYAVWDDGLNITYEGAHLLTQSLSTNEYSAGTIVRYSTDNHPINWNTHKGWKVDLPIAGERLVGDPQLRAGRLQFITTSFDAEGNPVAWMLQPHYLNGGVSTNVLFDLNADGYRDQNDTVNRDTDAAGNEIGMGDIPIGVRYGATGVFAQPTITRISNESDALLINGLLMPLPPDCVGSCSGGFAGGHVDVTTDSPLRGLINPHVDGISWGSADGIGGHVDNHEHEYDKVHGSVFVDAFELEPRRGKFSLNFEEPRDPIVARLSRVTEVCDPDKGSPPTDKCTTNTNTSYLFDGDKKFFIVLANADINAGASITIGNRSWKAQEYQDMVTNQLLGGTAGVDLKDTDGGSLIFSLNQIKSEGTLRIDYSSRAILDGGIHRTLPQCVWGITNPYNNKSHPFSSPNRHITEAQENGVTGYRWRNGSLVVQLIDVNDYQLQSAGIPRTGGNPVGGTHARYYLLKADETLDKVDDSINKTAPLTRPYHNGLLYELSVFSHYGDLFQLVRTGPPVTTPCYGASTYSAAIGIETKGLTKGEYDKKSAAFKNDPALQAEFAAALAAYENATTEAQLKETYDKLKAIIDANDLGEYMKYRTYIRGLIPPQHLLEWDKKLLDDTTVTQAEIPANVQDATPEGEQLGQNFRTGRRNWIDLTP